MKAIVIILTITLSLATLLFFLSVTSSGFSRALSRSIRRTWLAGLVRPELSIWDILLWSRKTADAMLQITKAYDWRVQQWSGLATGVLTASLAFISAVVLEYFKNSITIDARLKLWFTLLGVWASFLVYLAAQRRITFLRKHFTGLYTLLRRLAGD